MLTANRDYFCTHNCYIIVLRQSCQIILPRTYITAVNDGVLRALIDKRSKSKVLDSFDSPSDIIDYFNSILNCIDFELFPITSEAAVVAYLQMFLSGQNYYKSIMVNHHSSLGKADLIVDSNNIRLVFEFKFDKDGKHSLELLQKAKEQLQDKRYGKTVDCPPNFKAIATVYDATTRKLTYYEEVNY